MCYGRRVCGPVGNEILRLGGSENVLVFEREREEMVRTPWMGSLVGTRCDGASKSTERLHAALGCWGWVYRRCVRLSRCMK